MAIPATDDAIYEDLRESPRRRVLKGGIIAFNGRHCTLPCTVRDISDTGARLRAQSSISIPDHFELIIEIDGFEAECQVMWRRGSDVGVRFTGERHKARPKRVQVVAPVVPDAPVHLRKHRGLDEHPMAWSPHKVSNQCDAFLALLITIQPEAVRICTLVAVSTQIANALAVERAAISPRALMKYFPRESASLMSGGNRIAQWYCDTDLDHALQVFQTALAASKSITLDSAQKGLLWQPLPQSDVKRLAQAWQAASRAGHDLMVELDRMLSMCGIAGASGEHSQFLALLKAGATGGHQLITNEGEIRMPRWAEKRGFERTHIKAPALLVSDGRRRSVLVRDISPTGIGLECDTTLAMGEQVVVEIGKAITVSGTVIWSEDRRAGVKLDTGLHGDDPLMAFCVNVATAIA